MLLAEYSQFKKQADLCNHYGICYSKGESFVQTTGKAMSESKEYTITLDDDPMIVKIIEKFLGFPSLPYKSAEKLLANAKKYTPQAAFIDIQLEDECGLDIIPELKRIWPFTPLIAITASSPAESIGDALASGADDFIGKPLKKEELVSRYLARKRQADAVSRQSEIRYGDLILNFLQKRLSGEKGETFISPKEQAILTELIEANGTPVSRDTLIRKCWGSVKVSSGVLDRHVSGVRSAINNTSEKVEIKTRYGKGYFLEST